MKILMFSTDRSILRRDSDANRRMTVYGALGEELHVVLWSAEAGADAACVRIAPNVNVYPAKARLKAWSLIVAYRIGRELIRARNVSVITAQDPFETGFVAWLLKRRYRLPLQLQAHTDFLSPWFARESFKNRLRVRLAKFLLPRADRIRVVSERIKNSLLTLYPKPYTLTPISVLPIFAHPARERADPAAAEALRKEYGGYRFRILALSRLTREKNIALAIRAMRGIADAHRDTLLMIIGEGPERAALGRLVHALNLEANVRFIPWTEHPGACYAVADMFLLTSNYEGYGRTVAEAMAAGLPVVMTHVGLAGDVLVSGKNGIVVPVGDARAVAGAIAEIIEHPAYAGKLGEEARRTVNSFPDEQAHIARYRHALEFHP